MFGWRCLSGAWDKTMGVIAQGPYNEGGRFDNSRAISWAAIIDQISQQISYSSKEEVRGSNSELRG